MIFYRKNDFCVCSGFRKFKERKDIQLSTVDVLKKMQNVIEGCRVYIVGGSVRDYVRNEPNRDLDIVICGTPLELIKRFLGKHGTAKVVPLSKTNDTFTVSVLLFKASGDEIEAQITLPKRGDKSEQDHNNTLEDDSKCRDFRMNSMYLPIDFKSREDVIDLVGGIKDICERTISVYGDNTNKIVESPIRMMRAVSLAARTGFKLEESLVTCIEENAELINKCPADAIRTEFEHILMSKKPSKYLRLLKKTGLLKIIAPEVYACVDVEQDKKYHKYNVFTHLIYTVDNCDRDIVIRLAGLLHDIGKPASKKEENGRVSFHKHETYSVRQAKVLLRRLNYNKAIEKEVLSLIRLHMYHYTREWTDSAIRKFIKSSEIPETYLKEETISNYPLFRLRAGERLGNGLKHEAVTDKQRDFERRIVEVFKESSCFSVRDLAINGNIIMDVFKLAPGAHIGVILKSLLEAVIENPGLNNEKDLLLLTGSFIKTLNL